MSSASFDDVMRQKSAKVPSLARQQGRRREGRTVYVGLSGGVDSSVAAALLKQQGYKVVGIYMKNWSQDLPGMPCPWRDDFTDAKRVAVQLGIDFKMYDFEKDYRHKVVDYMLEEFKAGRTPNPDIMCNQEIKFKLFLNTALEDGADFVATGHYARIENSNQEIGNSKESVKKLIPNSQLLITRLLQAKDDNKDQTYFLYRVTNEALQKTIFPLGNLTKPEVRELAKKFKLVTATKKESMGICFVGKVGIKDFLMQYVDTKLGNIINQHGKVLGEHDGAIFYTIGQRHGLDVGGGMPFYVTGKDMKKNEVYVTTDLQDDKLWSKEIKLADMHWISKVPSSKFQVSSQNASQHSSRNSKLYVRTRHRAELIQVLALEKSGSNWTATLKDEVRALTPGQSAVFYQNGVCLGGGIVY